MMAQARADQRCAEVGACGPLGYESPGSKASASGVWGRVLQTPDARAAIDRLVEEGVCIVRCMAEQYLSPELAAELAGQERML